MSFERDLLNSAEMLVTRLYMQPCLMMRAFVCYQDDIAEKVASAATSDEEGKKERKMKPGETQQTINAKIVLKLDAMRARFCNLVYGVYDLHRDEDMLAFEVFLRLMLEHATRGKTKQMILTEDSLEWAVFRDVFLQGR